MTNDNIELIIDDESKWWQVETDAEGPFLWASTISKMNINDINIIYVDITVELHPDIKNNKILIICDEISRIQNLSYGIKTS